MQNYIREYKSLLVGYSKDKKIRERGSSGGALTSILIQALRSKLIDAAITVSMNKKQPWKPVVTLAKNEKEILYSQGSKYTLINFKDILAILNKNKDKKLAITALPCHSVILKNIKERYPNIKLIFGLFCGYNTPFKATEFLIRKSGIKKQEITSLEYRGGKYPGGFLIKSKDKKVFFPKHYYDIVNLMFIPKGCLSCKDYTSEKSDISFGDAWGYDNHTLIIVRTNIGQKLINQSNLKTKEISESLLYEMHKHNLKHKKQKDPLPQKIAMHFLKIFGKFIPFRFLGYLSKLRRKYKK
ncbi:Coenzyme F420 hydrogenase/dehydrogenase, beta subunit C-terminal domain [Candidatus Woesearchaeota archaeon]|nr:Coenzyme F420 hydrogenase/dehydrogenase, beta subunit C-terminal domain [Candidatus Woesearchaeota archaeon]